MNALERYLFDLNGYVVVENALDAVTVKSLNDLLDEKITELEDPHFQNHRFFSLLEWGGPMIDLIDHAPIMPYLDATIGPQLRMDHTYLDIIRRGLSPIGAILHGGGTPHDPAQFYEVRDGRMFNGLTVVAYNLKDVNPGDGGFACVPGSHKANFPLPEEWLDISENQSEAVRRVVGPAGTAIIFTEALTHGSLPWTSDEERRTIFFKYNHPAMSWANWYHRGPAMDGLTDAQKKLLAPPQDAEIVDDYMKTNDVHGV